MEDRKERVEAMRKCKEEEEEEVTEDSDSTADLDEIDCHRVDVGDEMSHDKAAGTSRGDNDQAAVPACGKYSLPEELTTSANMEPHR